MEKEWVIDEKKMQTKCKWSPFNGRKVKGAISRVVLRGEVAYVDGQVLVPPGFGIDLKDSKVPLVMVTCVIFPLLYLGSFL